MSAEHILNSLGAITIDNDIQIGSFMCSDMHSIKWFHIMSNVLI